MATKGHFAGSMQVVHKPNTALPQVLLWTSDRGQLIELPMTTEEMDSILEDTEDKPVYVQWYEWSKFYDD